MDAQIAARLIANDFFNSSQPPEHLHRMRFARSVLHHLGSPETAENLNHVMVLLAKHHVDHVGNDFPKVAVRKYDRAQKTVNNQQEEQDWVNMEEPPPPEPALGPMVEEVPPHQQNLDLTKQVPEAPKKMEHPAGRAPDAQTNAAADQANPEVLLGKSHQDDASTHDVHSDDFTDDEVHEHTHVDDDEVHVEEISTPVAANTPAPKRKRPQ